MSESLIVRVKRIVSANLFDAVDRMENAQAEAVMKEAVREVDRAIHDIRVEQGKALQRTKQATNQIEAYESKLAYLNQKIEFALGQDRDDLAKAAISRQVDYESQIKILVEAASESETQHLKMADYVAALEARKRDMEDQLKTLIAARVAAEDAMPAVLKTDGPLARVDNAAEAFARAMQSASHLHGAKSYQVDDAAKLAELDVLSHQNAIEQRLQEAKVRKSA
jgi:phage shock protein A